MDLATPIAALGSVGKKVSKPLNAIEVKTVADLLYYFPFRYEDYRQIVPVKQMQDGTLVTICVQVELIANKRSFKSKKMITEALVSDASGSVRVVWFNQPFIIKTIKTGDMIYLSGRVKSDMLGPQLISPTYEKYKKETAHTARLVPMYPLTGTVTQKQIRYLMSQAIQATTGMKDWLPMDIVESADLRPLSAAVHGIHFPVDDVDLQLSRDRLKFDELFLVQLKAEFARQGRKEFAAPVIRFQEEKIKSFVSSLPFTLTKSQKISAWEILQDINTSLPMNRLVSGDVGSGKTVVAAISIYSSYVNNFQSVLMAPTEILAFQHYQSLSRLFAGLGITVGLLTRNQILTSKDKNIGKKDFIAQVQAGEIHIVVGTHALLGPEVQFRNLALVIVDEQHRFGVEQRKLIKTKGLGAHFLSMTATPIPRSLALMIYGDLDISIINELPPGRKKITTKLVEPFKRDKAYQFIRDQVRQGRQVFVVCPLIEAVDSNKPTDGELPILMPARDDKKSVMSEYEKLSKQTFPDLRVGFLHGKMRSKEKEEVMARFKSGELDLLVSTSVIEVGVDIPNASVMMIEGAESFGLAQLHQFRGRVGRSSHQSYCLLFITAMRQDPAAAVANLDNNKSLERLKFFEQESDGFKLAEKDLEVRGPGEVYGTEQSGEMGLRLATVGDRDLIKKAREAAKVAMQNIKKYPQLVAKVKDWEKETHLE